MHNSLSILLLLFRGWMTLLLPFMKLARALHAQIWWWRCTYIHNCIRSIHTCKLFWNMYRQLIVAVCFIWFSTCWTWGEVKNNNNENRKKRRGIKLKSYFSCILPSAISWNIWLAREMHLTTYDVNYLSISRGAFHNRISFFHWIIGRCNTLLVIYCCFLCFGGGWEQRKFINAGVKY